MVVSRSYRRPSSGLQKKLEGQESVLIGPRFPRLQLGGQARWPRSRVSGSLQRVPQQAEVQVQDVSIRACISGLAQERPRQSGTKVDAILFCGIGAVHHFERLHHQPVSGQSAFTCVSVMPRGTNRIRQLPCPASSGYAASTKISRRSLGRRGLVPKSRPRDRLSHCDQDRRIRFARVRGCAV